MDLGPQRLINSMRANFIAKDLCSVTALPAFPALSITPLTAAHNPAEGAFPPNEVNSAKEVIDIIDRQNETKRPNKKRISFLSGLDVKSMDSL
ncbi:MAG: hypothetical protein C5B49_15975 [Bdellovibrio sp.]|nr:MAG: hypothetical protein C5B49_15975 [Bdellovibrio sp.]